MKISKEEGYKIWLNTKLGQLKKRIWSSQPFYERIFWDREKTDVKNQLDSYVKV